MKAFTPTITTTCRALGPRQSLQSLQLRSFSWDGIVNRTRDAFKDAPMGRRLLGGKGYKDIPIGGQGLKINSIKEDLRPKVVVLGSGWGAFTLLNDIDKSKYRVMCISPSNHFLFTPLLPSSAVGTLEFRSIEEPIRTIKGVEFFQGKATRIDKETRRVEYKDLFEERVHGFEYDYLVISVGSKTNTFNTPGIAENEGKNVFFLKHLYHARQIRNNIVDCFEKAAIHHQYGETEERDRLLSFVVVGGGPTSCEFVGELYDFVTSDVARWYSDLEPYIRVTLVEAGPKLLGSFDMALSKYVMDRFKSRAIDVRLDTAVVELKDSKTTVLSDGTEIPTGMMVWSAGLQQVNLVKDSLTDVKKGPTGRILIDDYLRVPPPTSSDTDTTTPSVSSTYGRLFAIGDCAVNEKTPLPPLAQGARLQAKWLAKELNVLEKNEVPTFENSKPFKFFGMGSMASIGSWEGVLDFSHVGEKDKDVSLGKFSGFLSFLVWRTAYWGKQVSATNKILIPLYWFNSYVFGRDISRF